MKLSKQKILMIGYGNPCRVDDGIGPALAERTLNECSEDLDVESDYQLSIENALDVSRNDIVIFADASLKGREPFYFKEIHAREPMNISSHGISPEEVLYFAEKMFNSKVRGYLLGIRGYEFSDYGEGLSHKAKQNLDAAFLFIQNLLRS